MEINIIRGQNQIGGSIIEISSKSTKIILDIGSNLEDKEIVVPEIDGLFKGKAKYDGVLISHYHSDHEGQKFFLRYQYIWEKKAMKYIRLQENI